MITVKKHNEGQAIIEFIFGLMMVISFFFFYVKLAAVFAVGNYIHYATFMAARAYYSSAQNESMQQSNAEAVVQKMLSGKWKKLYKAKGGSSGITGVSIGKGPYYEEDPFQNFWNQGVMFHFETSLSLYPWDRMAPPLVIPLTSESWMGREETHDECMAKKSKIKDQVGAAVNYWENGNDGC